MRRGTRGFWVKVASWKFGVFSWGVEGRIVLVLRARAKARAGLRVETKAKTKKQNPGLRFVGGFRASGGWDRAGAS